MVKSQFLNSIGIFRFSLFRVFIIRCERIPFPSYSNCKNNDCPFSDNVSLPVGLSILLVSLVSFPPSITVKLLQEFSILLA